MMFLEDPFSKTLGTVINERFNNVRQQQISMQLWRTIISLYIETANARRLVGQPNSRSGVGERGVVKAPSQSSSTWRGTAINNPLTLAPPCLNETLRYRCVTRLLPRRRPSPPPPPPLRPRPHACRRLLLRFRRRSTPVFSGGWKTPRSNAVVAVAAALSFTLKMEEHLDVLLPSS